MESRSQPDEEASAGSPVLDLLLAGRELRGAPHTAGRRASTLVHGQGLNVVLMHLVSGAALAAHSAAAGLTIHVLEGHARIGVGGQQLEVTRGQLVAVEGAVHHSIEASEDTLLLLTVATPAAGAPQ